LRSSFGRQEIENAVNDILDCFFGEAECAENSAEQRELFWGGHGGYDFCLGGQ
jgi:hypothetical protein